jgi:hypothetical protein
VYESQQLCQHVCQQVLQLLEQQVCQQVPHPSYPPQLQLYGLQELQDLTSLQLYGLQEYGLQFEYEAQSPSL